jgi:uncharacterized protein with GYD domain
MARYILLGTYTSDAIKGISGERTEKVKSIIKQADGKVQSIYTLLGGICDLVLLVDFPNNEDAMKASVGITKATGIRFSSCPAVEAEAFDRLVSK